MLVKMVGCAGLCLGLAFCAHTALAQNEITNNVATTDEPFPISYEDVGKVPEDFHRQGVPYDTPHPAGTLMVDADNRYLYLVLPEGRAIRYGIGVGREGFEWSGSAEIGRRTTWPYWFPPKAMIAHDRFAAKWAKGMPGGPKNPLGACALYLHANGTYVAAGGAGSPEQVTGFDGEAPRGRVVIQTWDSLSKFRLGIVRWNTRRIAKLATNTPSSAASLCIDCSSKNSGVALRRGQLSIATDWECTAVPRRHRSGPPPAHRAVSHSC